MQKTAIFSCLLLFSETSFFITFFLANGEMFRNLVKFIYSEKAAKICEISFLLLTAVHRVKSKGKISKNFDAFSEHMNFNVRIFWGHRKVEDWFKFFWPSHNILNLLHCEPDWIKIPWPRTPHSKRGHVGQNKYITAILIFWRPCGQNILKVEFLYYLFFVKFDLILVSFLFR